MPKLYRKKVRSLIEQNRAEFAKAGIVDYHKEGIYGQGVVGYILDDEGDTSPDMESYTFKPFQNHFGVGHKTNVAKVAHEIAPQAKHGLFNFTGKKSNKRESIDWIMKNPPDIINCSFSSPIELLDDFERLEQLDIPIVCSSGNQYKKGGVNYPAMYPWTLGIGALEEYLNRVAPYSNSGPGLDGVAFTDIYIPNSSDMPIPFSGTSCAAPVAYAMLMLYMSWRKQKGLPRLSRDECYEFFRSNCHDYPSTYRDGQGLFILPKPEQLEVIITNKPEHIIIHHSATREGDAAAFRKAHMAKGWKDIGYHYVIGNGTYSEDGLVEAGRAENEVGAHCNSDGMNHKSIGICLVGNFDEQTPTPAQMQSLGNLIRDIMARYNIPAGNILGHKEVPGAATSCPGKNFDMSAFRKRMEGKEVEKKDYEGHWAEESIKKVLTAGIMQGYPDGSFKPDQPVTRAELATVLAKIIEK